MSDSTVCLPEYHYTGAPRIFAIAATAGAYLIAGIMALSAYPIDHGIAGIWPGAGIAVAAALIVGPIAAIGVFVGDALLALHIGLDLFPALTLALGAAAESLLAWYLLTRVTRFDYRLQRIRDVAQFIVLGAAPAAICCVFLRVILLSVLGQDVVHMEDWTLAYFAGFLGHALGVLIVAPVILTSIGIREPLVRTGELALLMLASILLNLMAFSTTPIAPGAALIILAFVTVLWAALRFGVREAAVIILITSIFATIAAGKTMGPFLLVNSSQALFSLSLLLLVATVTSLFLAAAASERKRYLAKMVESEAAHRSLVEHMSDGLARIDIADRIIFASDRFCELCGWSHADLVGRTLNVALALENSATLDLALSQCRQDRLARLETELPKRPPVRAEVASTAISARFVSLAMHHLDDSTAGSGNVMVVMSDITERRIAEAEAREHLAQMARMNRLTSMDEMASAFAHEVAQPLTSIGNYVQAARRFSDRQLGQSEGLAQALAGAEREADRAIQIVRRIRDFVQNRTKNPGRIECGSLIHEVIALARPEANQYEIVLNGACNPGCSDVLADRIQIQQVLLNLVRNAVEAMEKQDSPVRRVCIEARPADKKFVVFHVDDTGPGIPEVHIQKIFDPFFSTKECGSGIGLSLCRSIVEVHGGRLWVEKIAAGGTRFGFSLPTWESHDEPE